MQPFHLAAYNESVTAVTNSDINAVEDEVIQRRNSHLILSEPYNLLAACCIGNTLTRMRFGNVSLQYRGIQHLWPMNGGAATVPSRPEVQERFDNPLPLPVDEEITLEGTTTDVGAVDANAVLWLATPNWSPRVPVGEDIGFVRGTVVIAAGAESAWTAPVALTLERDLFRGVYAVVGAYVIAANAIAFRFVFRTSPKDNGRQHRPGGLVMNAAGDIPYKNQDMRFGEYGRFATYELPSIQTLDDTAGGTYEVRLHLIYLGQEREALYTQ